MAGYEKRRRYDFMMNDTVLIFDLDGTLLDTIEDLGNAANHVLSSRGLPLHNREEYPSLVGNGIRNLLKRALPQEFIYDEFFMNDLECDFKKYYSEHIHDYTKPYPGIPGLLQSLQKEGFLLAVASNKFESGTKTLINHFFKDIFFQKIIGNKPGIALKPSPDVVSDILSDTSVSNAIMIGDSEVDILTAKAAGIPSIAVSWGFRRKEDLIAADNIADNVMELYSSIHTIYKD